MFKIFFTGKPLKTHMLHLTSKQVFRHAAAWCVGALISIGRTRTGIEKDGGGKRILFFEMEGKGIKQEPITNSNYIF